MSEPLNIEAARKEMAMWVTPPQRAREIAEDALIELEAARERIAELEGDLASLQERYDKVTCD